jgi:protein-tyrosine phosphatase
MLVRPARRLAARVRDRVDGGLHPRRHQRVLARLRELQPRSVLFLCLGNVCRSPYAERVLAARGPEGVQVASAGFIKPGRPPAHLAIEVASDRGIQHSDHRSRVVTPDDLRSLDVIFFFDRYNKARLMASEGVREDRVFWLGDLEPEYGGRRAILDPWGKPREEFERVFDRIDRCVARLHGVLQEPPGQGSDGPTDLD